MCPDCGEMLVGWTIGGDPIGWYCKDCNQKFKMKHYPMDIRDEKFYYTPSHIARYPQDFNEVK